MVPPGALVPTKALGGGTVPLRVPFVEYDEVGAICTECGRTFPSPDALQAHRTESHAARESPRPPAKAVRCTVCRARFPSTDALARHNRAAHLG